MANKAWNRLERGETFEAVAKAMSEDKMSAAEGGFLGYVQYMGETVRFFDGPRRLRRLVMLRVAQSAGIENVRAHP